MVKYMTEYVEKKEGKLSTEERNLLSVAYKNQIGNKRSSWRILSNLETKETDEGKLEILKEYKKTVESELNDIYKNVLQLIDNHLTPNATGGEEKVFYFKM